MTTKMASTKRAIIFLSTHILFSFALAFLFLPSAWAGEDLSTLRSKAEAGDPKPQNNLGLLYENHPLDHQDISKVVYWFSKAAHWYRLAAKQGYAKAQVHLGVLYQIGLGVGPQDAVKAAYWFRLAAKQGYVDAQNDLGDLYATGGPGLPQDFSKAAYWHLLATGHH